MASNSYETPVVEPNCNQPATTVASKLGEFIRQTSFKRCNPDNNDQVSTNVIYDSRTCMFIEWAWERVMELLDRCQSVASNACISVHARRSPAFQCLAWCWRRRDDGSIDWSSSNQIFFVQDPSDDMTSKRTRCSSKKNVIDCPISQFGCMTDVPCDRLNEHYSSTTHQTVLLQLVKDFIQRLHEIPRDNDRHFDPKALDVGEIFDSINTLAEGLSCLTDDNVNNYKQVVILQDQLSQQNEKLGQLKKSVDECGETLHANQINQDILQTEIDSIKQTLTESTGLSTNDGSFIWKISNVGEKIQNALNDRQTSIYSPPFFSSPTGYKMCMRLYLNGDGNARRTHMSLFFVLMRGDYDAILPWPFQHKINFCLYDQTGNRRHILDSFRPDFKSNSFQRPRSNMNIASGIPKFFPTMMFQQENNSYIRDDCMFIRCVVDLAALPKTVLPFVMLLNPALPTAMQYEMVQAEIQKQAISTSSASNSEIRVEGNVQREKEGWQEKENRNGDTMCMIQVRVIDFCSKTRWFYCFVCFKKCVKTVERHKERLLTQLGGSHRDGNERKSSRLNDSHLKLDLGINLHESYVATEDM